jgi:hypothetical protein
LGDSLDLAPQVIQQILGHPSPMPIIEPASGAYQQALEHFRERLPEVESYVWRTIGQGDISQPLYQANQRFARDIMAALSLGDVGLLGTETARVENLLLSYGMPSNLVAAYLSAYDEALQTHLGPQGAPLQAWLAGLKGQH